MKALFIGQSYIDITFLTDHLPSGDEKTVARDYAVSFGGDAVTAAFSCAKLGIARNLLASVADDWLGRMFVDMAAKYGISVHHRKVAEILTVVHHAERRPARDRAMPRRQFQTSVSDAQSCRLPRVASRRTSSDAAIHYAKICHEAGILTSLDGGGLRSNTHDLLPFIGTALVAERLCEQMKLTPGEMLSYLRSRGCRIGGVTMGAQGLLWYDQRNRSVCLSRPPCPGAPDHRHQRRRRYLSWGVRVLVSDRSGCRLGATLQVRARRVRPFDPVSRQ